MYGTAAEECRMGGTSDGVAARGFVNGTCRAAAGGKAPQVRTGPKSLPAGRLGRGNTVPARRQTRLRKHGPCPQADLAAGTPPSVLRVAIFAESVENDYISVENDYIWKQL